MFLLPAGAFNGRFMEPLVPGERYVSFPQIRREARSKVDPRLRDRSEDAIRCLESNRDALSALSPCGLFPTKADVFLCECSLSLRHGCRSNGLLRIEYQLVRSRESTDSRGNDGANDDRADRSTGKQFAFFFSFLVPSTLIFSGGCALP